MRCLAVARYYKKYWLTHKAVGNLIEISYSSSLHLNAGEIAFLNGHSKLKSFSCTMESAVDGVRPSARLYRGWTTLNRYRDYDMHRRENGTGIYYGSRTQFASSKEHELSKHIDHLIFDSFTKI